MHEHALVVAQSKVNTVPQSRALLGLDEVCVGRCVPALNEHTIPHKLAVVLEYV
jgi:hypothetical protein